MFRKQNPEMQQNVLLHTDSAIIIDLLASHLKNNGIEVIIINHPNSAIVAGFGTSQQDVDLFIDSTYEKEAKLIMSQVLS